MPARECNSPGPNISMDPTEDCEYRVGSVVRTSDGASTQNHGYNQEGAFALQ